MSLNHSLLMTPVASKRNVYLVSGVCCPTEEGVLRKVLDAGLGAETYAYNSVTCELAADRSLDHARVMTQVRRAGFDARLRQDAYLPQTFLRRHKAGSVTGTALVLAATGLGLETAAPAVSGILLLAAVVSGGWTIAVKAMKPHSGCGRST